MKLFFRRRWLYSHIIVFIFYYLTCQVTQAQCSGFQFALGGTSYDRAFDVAPSSNSEFFVAGITKSFSTSDDILVSKLSIDGNLKWSKTYNAPGTEILRKINPTTDGGLLIAGQTTSFDNSRGEILCMKINSSGALVWSKKFGVGSPNGDLGMNLIELSTGGYALTGILNVNGGVSDVVVMHLDNNGNPLWSKRFDRGDGEDGVGILQISDTLVISADLQNTSSHYEFLVMKLKLSDGKVIMSKKITPGSRGLFNPYIYKNASGAGYIISGHTIDFSSYDNMQQTIIELDDNFNVLETKAITTATITNDFFTGFYPLPDGSFITCATPQMDADGYIYRINKDKSVRFSKRFNASDGRRLYRLTVMGNNVIAVGGAIQSGEEDFFITGFGADGLSGSFCDVEDVITTIQSPDFTSVSFSWPTINNVLFSNTSASLQVADAQLQKVDLCINKTTVDFQYFQDTCLTKKVNFSTKLDNIKRYIWEFGDGQVNFGSANPFHLYSDYNLYPVKMKVEYTSGCIDSITKNIDLNLQFDNIMLNDDTTICIGDSVLLKTADPGLSFCWQPSTGLSNSTIANPIAKPLSTTTYVFTSKTIGKNLVVNNTFNDGNSGFTSTYGYAPSGIPPAVYTIAKEPELWHPAMPACRDHSTGTGNMMMVNGSEQLNVNVWSQTIQIVQNTNYAFSTWLQTITTINPAKLQFSINGNVIGSIFTADARSCKWSQFYSIWNSGSSTTATISIVNMNQEFSGNDFAIDDIFFGEISVKQDSIRIAVDSKPDINLGKDLTTCKGSSIELKAIVADADKIIWRPSQFLSDTTVSNPIALPLHGITYTVEAISLNGCNKMDTLSIAVVERPKIETRNDTTICQSESVVLNTQSTNATLFTWQPDSSLSSTSVKDPIATPTATTKYIITAANTGCESKDSVIIGVKALPVIKVSNDTTICQNSKVQIYAQGGVEYKWSPASDLSSETIADPFASPIKTTQYNVSVKAANGCTKRDSVKVSVIPLPSFKLYPQVQSLCLGDPAVITASGGGSYRWFIEDSILVESSNKLTIIPVATTYFKVAISQVACKMDDTLFATVNIFPRPVTLVSKSNDIDCASTEAQLTASGGTRYEWFPKEGLSNAFIFNPIASPWQTTKYQVNIKSTHGCLVEDSITIKVSSNGESGFYIPSAFTPNGDGINDCFNIKSLGNLKEFTILIYNRWGEKVFQSNSSSFCWNGIYKSIEQPSGTFVYYIKVKALCGDVFRKGTVILIR